MNGLSTHKIPKRIIGLDTLSRNLWWCWHNEARELFKMLDRPLWKATCHNPVKLLQLVPAYQLVKAAEDPAFTEKYDAVIQSFQGEMAGAQADTWFSARYAGLSRHTIAYFSMEFALHNSVPIYAGGLGVLAGDYCKEASDLGLPLVGIGFMYPQGYFRQRINDEGWQEEIYRQLDFNETPIVRVLDESKRRVKIEVELDSRKISVAACQLDIGRVRLYLLDTDIEENAPADRQLTARLYSGDRELRLQQEIILGVGGVRMLRALGVDPAVWHANEGHAAFMVLERCREMVQRGIGFEEAFAAVRATTVFTTHTPVPAGNDAFALDLMGKYWCRYWTGLGLDSESFFRLGEHGQEYNMTVLGLRAAQYRNGVSELHGAVCRRMWCPVWPDTAEKDVPIGSITNGVHVPTWLSPQMARLYDKYLGADWLQKHDDPAVWERIESIPDEELWTMRLWLKNKLVSLAQSHARRRWGESHGSPTSALAMGALLESGSFTIGFSRRFTDYKRAVLILRDMERLKKLFHDELRPVQIIFAGKAHPNDLHGKHLIQEVYNVARNSEFRGRIAFIEDYDIHLAHYLVSGVDVWLNTPRPMQEASGTSGMKAGVNGVPNLSVLDGWWYEGYNGTNGWAIDNEVANPSDQDAADAGALYHLLEEKVIPLYYDRDLSGVPHGWMKVVKQAIRSCAPLFSSRRMVKEYAEQMYVPAAQAAGKADRVVIG